MYTDALLSSHSKWTMDADQGTGHNTRLCLVCVLMIFHELHDETDG